ncbi:MAG: hypothetical protein HKN79_01890 [Flavobacteriales bacterium]|nr:hypothetical protein [Flavobacteriales bacterium]
MQRDRLKNIATGAIGGVLIVLLLLFILPIDVVYEVKVDTRTYPTKEWKLIQEGSQFRTVSLDNSGSQAPTEKNFVFDRGDVIDIRFNEEIASGEFVDQGETLLQFSSMMHNLRIQRALNEIEINESRKVAGNAAMKWPLLREAEDAVELARSNVRLQEANHQRLAQLKDDGVISQAELDAQVNRLEVARQELAIAEQRVANASFEQKPEDVAVFNTVIETVDKELDVLLAQQGSYTLKSPFEGRLQLQPAEGVVLSLVDTTSISLVFPFPIDQRQYLQKNSLLEFESESDVHHLSFDLKDQAAIIQGDQQCLGVAHLEGEQLVMGAMRPASVICDTVRLREYLFRKLL